MWIKPSFFFIFSYLSYNILMLVFFSRKLESIARFSFTSKISNNIILFKLIRNIFRNHLTENHSEYILWNVWIIQKLLIKSCLRLVHNIKINNDLKWKTMVFIRKAIFTAIWVYHTHFNTKNNLYISKYGFRISKLVLDIVQQLWVRMIEINYPV